MRAAKRALRDPFRVLKRLHALAEIVERGALGSVERHPVNFPHRERVGVVVGLGADGRTLNVAMGDQSEDIAPADLAHAPLVAGEPQFRKGVRVVARVGYNAVREGDWGVIVGPCSMRTMPNAPNRVLVAFGTGKGIYNYAAGTQLAIAADDD